MASATGRGCFCVWGGWFLDPDDAAISKYVRGQARDRAWIRAGLEAGILSLANIEYRLRETVMETDERRRVKAAVADDRNWLDHAST